MISTVHFQEAIVDLLKADTALVAVVGAEIREADYQATNWVYPNVRIGRPEVQPASEGCNYPVSFTVSVNSKNPSSMECSQLFDLVGVALERHQIVTTEIQSTQIIYQGCAQAYRTGVDSWRADLYFSTRAVKPSS